MLVKTPITWLGMLRIYAVSVTALHFGWELLQLPLYTIWRTASMRELAFAIVHCTAGDLLIATGCLFAALLLAGAPDWPNAHFKQVGLLTVLLGLAYTGYSEWHNTVVKQTWTYAASMPTIFGIGWAPLAQWLIVPLGAFWVLRRRLD